MRPAVVIASLGVAACFDPHPQPGSPCSVDGRCPNGQVCRADVCVLEGDGVDGPPGADAPPGVIDATPPVDAYVCVPWDVPNVGDPCPLLTPGSLVMTGPGWSMNTETGEVKHGATSFFPPSTMITLIGTGIEVRVFALDDFTIDPTTDVNVEGDFGAIIVVHGNATILGELHASAVATAEGPGGPGFCQPGTAATAGTASGGGGGGAGFGKDGGEGGDGAGDAVGGTGGPGGTRGQQVGSLQLVPLRAGCRGSQGAGPGGGSAPGGAPGGALEISARDVLTVSGTIAANGGGGRGGGVGIGGGGGGSGGALLLDGGTVTITATAIVVANGGGGGGGGGLAPGQPGSDGRLDAMTASGGPGSGGGGTGGGGGRRNQDNGQSGGDATSLSGAGGGGAGGAVGRIQIQARSGQNIDGNAVISPSAD
jgi:hypothetical protein